jgi:hypothetical protein
VIDTGCCAKQDHLILRVKLRRSFAIELLPAGVPAMRRVAARQPRGRSQRKPPMQWTSK